MRISDWSSDVCSSDLGDEPSFTQPLMYERIRKHPPVSQLCAAKLQDDGVIDAGWADARRAEFTARLEGDFEAAKTYKPNKADWFAGRWSGLYAPTESEHARRNIATGVSEKLFDSIGRTLTTIPADVEAHKTLRRVIDARGAMFADKKDRSEEHTSELRSLMRISYAVFCLKKTNTNKKKNKYTQGNTERWKH